MVVERLFRYVSLGRYPFNAVQMWKGKGGMPFPDVRVSDKYDKTQHKLFYCIYSYVLSLVKSIVIFVMG